MIDHVDYACLVRVLEAVAGKIKSNRDYLSRLDSAIGDGDHGTATFKVADAISTAIGKNTSGDIKTLLNDIGWAVMSTDAGSTSPLYGSLFLGMSEAITGTQPLDGHAFVAMLEQGVAKLRKNTKADVGGKTMMDTIVPAMAAIRAAVDSGKDLAQVLSEGAESAVKGAESTKAMKAAFGRAKNLGERSIGHIDPGAVSMALFFVGIKEGYTSG